MKFSADFLRTLAHAGKTLARLIARGIEALAVVADLEVEGGGFER